MARSHRRRRFNRSASRWQRCGMATLLALLIAAAPAHAQQDRIDDILAAIVGVNADVPATARTADTLGTSRAGSGVVIDDNGLVLTIGYLILESGITDVIDASGDVALGDPPPGEKGWKIGIAPLKADQPPERFLELANCAISTSGENLQSTSWTLCEHSR